MDALQTVSKAIAAALAGALISYAARHNLVFDASTSAAITTVVAAILAFAVTYLAPKNKS